MAGNFRPRVTIKEESIASPLVATAQAGRMAYVVESVKGRANRFLFPSDEQTLAATLGNPNSDSSSRDFHVAKSYLAYGNDLVIVRAINAATAKLGRVGIDFATLGFSVPLSSVNDNKYFEKVQDHSFALDLANHPSIDMSIFTKEAYDHANEISIAWAKFVPNALTGQTRWADYTATIDGSTKFSDTFEFGPRDANKEIALVVLKNGLIVESFIVSLLDGNKNEAGENNYITDYLDAKSDFIWGFAASTAYNTAVTSSAIGLLDGSAGTTPSASDFETAYSLFTNKNAILFDYVTEGTHSSNRAYIMASISEGRKDNIAFFGPKYSDIIGINNTDTIVANIVADRQSLGNSTWSAYFGQWKLMYDKYRDKNVWIPVTGDVIGNKVRVNTNLELWQPAAGNVNGQIANVVQLAFAPSETQQNTLYKNAVNLVLSKAGVGFVVDTQKTMTDQNIGVSRLHLRDMFRFIEINVANALADFLQAFNDAQTRIRVKSIVDALLEDIQTRRGIVDFQVICDDTNNTAAIIDNGGLRMTVKIKGNKAVEDIVITFYDVPNSVSFSEVAPA